MTSFKQETSQIIAMRPFMILLILIPAAVQADTEAPGDASATALFARYCVSCHGGDVAGVPDLTDGVWKFGGSLEAIEGSIANGRSSVMPGLGVALGDVGLDQVLAYVLRLDEPAAGHTDELAAGRGLFGMFCASCHGDNGTGTQVIGALDLTDRVWLYGGDADVIRDVITNGRASEMPAQREILSREEISLLANFVIDLGTENAHP
jgi:cytochrome c oxidase cbb3-type subunit 3